MSDVDRVRDFYDRGAADEWARLERNWLEFALTKAMLQRFLPPKARVLDIGGGPGRYALDLTAQAHQVDLLDLSAANVALAQEKARALGLALNDARVADARDLADYPSDHYEAVLMLGPLYHLTEDADRGQAIGEALRVLKPGGVAAFGFLSRYAAAHFFLKTGPEAIAERRAAIEAFLYAGTHRATPAQDFFVDAHLVDPAEVPSTMAAFGIDRLAYFGAEGMMAQSEWRLGEQPADIRRQWFDLALATAELPAALYGSEHLVFVGRKQV